MLRSLLVTSVLALSGLAAVKAPAGFAFAGIKPRPLQAAAADDAAGANHGFYASALRTYRVVANGRFRTLKMTSGDVHSRHEELVYLGTAHPRTVPSTESGSAADEEVVVVVVDEQETEAGIVQSAIDTVRDAYDTYLAPLLGSAADTLNSAARDALAWIGSVWGPKASELQRHVLSRLALLQVDRETGQALILHAAGIDVKVVRVGQVVFEASKAAVATEDVDGVRLSASLFVFEAGDVIVSGSTEWWAGVPLDEVLLALSGSARLGAKADAIVRLAPKSETREARFLLGLFE